MAQVSNLDFAPEEWWDTRVERLKAKVGPLRVERLKTKVGPLLT